MFLHTIYQWYAHASTIHTTTELQPTGEKEKNWGEVITNLISNDLIRLQAHGGVVANQGRSHRD